MNHYKNLDRFRYYRKKDKFIPTQNSVRENLSQRFMRGLDHFKGRLPTLLLVQIHLGMFDQTSDNLLEVFLLGRVPVPLAELDGREESGVVVIVLEH